MTYQVKEGDVLEYRGDGTSKSKHNFTVGKRYVVKKDGLGSYIVSDTGTHAIAAPVLFETFGFHLVTTPPETIQHEGYNYTRGEPVVPEWVKDGAWVINKENGELNQLIAGDPGYFSAVNKKTWHAFVLDFHPSMSVSDVFRPFTNEDWKWGMWAEYQGEKVFVVIPEQRTKHAMISGKDFPTGLKYVPLYNLTPTTAP